MEGILFVSVSSFVGCFFVLALVARDALSGD